MLLADEWSDYAHERKPLRVTDPVESQRSTYRLQLPYRYGIPLLVFSGTFHWLVSQTFFLARVMAFQANGKEDTANSISTVGYSCIALIVVIPFGTIAVLIAVMIGFRTYRPGIPMLASCSAAISAACYRSDDDIDAATKPLLWGSAAQPDDEFDPGTKVIDWGGRKRRVGHCCLTSFEVARGDAVWGILDIMYLVSKLNLGSKWISKSSVCCYVGYIIMSTGKPVFVFPLSGKYKASI